MRCGTLNWRHSDAQGAVSFSREFRESYGLLQLDALKDWIYDLEQEYDRIHALEFGGEPKPATQPGSPDEPQGKPSRDP